MKVLLCSPYLGTVGGISLWTKRLMNYYSRIDGNDLELEVFSLSRSSAIHANTRVYKRLFLGTMDYAYLIISYCIQFAKNNYEVVHLVSSGSLGLFKDIFFLLIAKILGKKRVLHFRFGRIPSLILYRNWEFLLMKFSIFLANKVIVIDLKSYNALVNHGCSKIIYLPNPVDDNVVSFVDKNKSDRNKRVILFAGHVVPTKGIFELIEATERIDDVEVRIAGFCSEGMKNKIQEQKSPQSKYKLLGELKYEEILIEMLKCGIFVLPSYTEGFPNVILESMACGCPIVATDVGAIPEMLSEFEGTPCGYCIKPMDSGELNDKINFVLNNYEDSQLIGLNAKKKVSHLYSMDKIWKELKQIWFNI